MMRKPETVIADWLATYNGADPEQVDQYVTYAQQMIRWLADEGYEIVGVDRPFASDREVTHRPYPTPATPNIAWDFRGTEISYVDSEFKPVDL